MQKNSSKSKFFSVLWDCKICWKMTLAVFFSVLIIEAIILIPSFKNYEKSQLNKIEATALASFKTLFQFQYVTKSSPGKLNKITKKIMQITPIKGALITNPDGTTFLSFGEIPAEAKNKLPVGSHWYRNLRTENGTRYDVIWHNNDLQADYTVEARLNTEHLDKLLIDFIVRIIALVAIIAAFVNIVIMLVMKNLFLDPILNIKSRMLNAMQNIENAQNYILTTRRKDEFGELAQAMNKLFTVTNSSLNEVKNKELALQEINNTLETRVKLRTKELSDNNVKLETEIKERKRYEKEIIQLANYDLVTELPNRNLFFSKLEQMIMEQENNNAFIAVFIIELNEFQDINDAFGHHIGDLLLKETGQNLKTQLVNISSIGRIGSYQLALFSEYLESFSSSAQIADKILELFAKPFTISSQLITSTINIGISISPQNGTEAKMLIRNADIALQRAKKSHHNSYQYYQADMNKIIEYKHNLLVDLHYAIEKSQLILHYQPQLDLPDEKITGVEALIRWQHPEKGLIFPGKFIDIAEESGLIVHIGKWVLQEACKQTKLWHEQGFADLRIAVNLSAIQFRQAEIIDTVKQALEQSGLPSANLELEITESVVMHNVEEAIQTMYALHNLGLVLSMDDFGTGYSSLSYLKRFPVHKIKIDQSFIRSINEETNESSIADSIIYLGHKLDLKVIAEGVETQFQADFLKEAKCDEAQGYYYGKPMEADKLLQLLKKQG